MTTDTNNIDEEEVLLDDDVEALRKKLLNLFEQGEIKTTKAFLNNKKKATEKVMKKMMEEYNELKSNQARVEMAITLVSLLPSLIDKFGIIKFKNGASDFSDKILADANCMHCLANLMPSTEGGDSAFKYLSASVFLGSTIYTNVEFVSTKKEEKVKEGVSTSSS